MKTLIRITLFLLPFAGNAQNEAADHKNDEAYTSFSVEVHAPDSVLQSFPQSTIIDALSIRGLKKTTTSPSLLVSFTSRNLVICEEGVRELTISSNDGAAAGTKTVYFLEILYTLPCDGKCYNAQNKLLYSGSWGKGQSKFISGQMATRREAEDYWKDNKEELRANFITSIIQPAIVAMGGRLNAGLH